MSKTKIIVDLLIANGKPSVFNALSLTRGSYFNSNRRLRRLAMEETIRLNIDTNEVLSSGYKKNEDFLVRLSASRERSKESAQDATEKIDVQVKRNIDTRQERTYPDKVSYRDTLAFKSYVRKMYEKFIIKYPNRTVGEAIETTFRTDGEDIVSKEMNLLASKITNIIGVGEDNLQDVITKVTSQLELEQRLEPSQGEAVREYAVGAENQLVQVYKEMERSQEEMQEKIDQLEEQIKDTPDPQMRQNMETEVAKLKEDFEADKEKKEKAREEVEKEADRIDAKEDAKLNE